MKFKFHMEIFVTTTIWKLSDDGELCQAQSAL